MLKSKTAGSIEEDSVQDNSKSTWNRGKSNKTVYNISNVISNLKSGPQIEMGSSSILQRKQCQKLIGQVIEAVDSNITIKLLKQTVPEKCGWPHSR